MHESFGCVDFQYKSHGFGTTCSFLDEIVLKSSMTENLPLHHSYKIRNLRLKHIQASHMSRIEQCSPNQLISRASKT